MKSPWPMGRNQRALQRAFEAAVTEAYTFGRLRANEHPSPPPILWIDMAERAARAAKAAYRQTVKDLRRTR